MLWNISYTRPDGTEVHGEPVETDDRLHAHVQAREQFAFNETTAPDFQLENDPDITITPAA